MPPAPQLKVNDYVSVLTQSWGEAWARKQHGDKDWKTGRTYGTVLRYENSKWVCDFAEKDGKHAAWMLQLASPQAPFVPSGFHAKRKDTGVQDLMIVDTRDAALNELPARVSSDCKDDAAKSQTRAAGDGVNAKLARAISQYRTSRGP